MRIQIAAAVLSLCALAAGQAVSQAPTGARLLALSKRDHTLSIVDPATLRVEARIPSGDDPHEVEASTDGRTAYISNYGYGAFHTITVVDLPARTQSKVIDLTPLRAPHGLFFADGKLWFTAEVNKVIGRYDPTTGKVDFILGTGQDRTHMVYVLPGTQRIVTTNVNSGTLSILDHTETPSTPPPPPPSGAMPGSPPGGYRPIVPSGGNWIATVLPTGHGGEGFDVSPDGKQAWVANAGDGTITIIDLAAKRVAENLNVNIKSANRLKFTPDGKRVFVSMLAQPDVLVLDAATHAVIKRIPIGHGAAGILMQPDGARAYVACTPDDYVAVIDLKTLEVVGRIDAGGNPDGLAWAVIP
jgi:YVTN family beta-propeller protein